jgi:hypothetical protein
MKSLFPILIALVFGSVSAQAQSGLEVSEDELTAATLEQMAEEARSEKISRLFEKLSSAHHIEISLQSRYRFSEIPFGLSGADSALSISITFNNGSEIEGDATLAGGKTACIATLISLAGELTTEPRSLIKASLHSLDRFDLAEQRVFAATWKGAFYSANGQALGSATLECGIGWASLGGLISQPEELSPQVLQYNLGDHARVFRTNTGNR